VGLDTGDDEIGEVRIARLIKGRADTAEHFRAGRSELRNGLECQLLHLGFADIARLVPDGSRFRRRCFGHNFSHNGIIHGVNIPHHNSLSTFHFLVHHHYVFSIMRPKSKIDLLEELRDFMSEALTNSHATRFGTISEKRRNRKLKRLRKEVDKWIDELEEKDKLDETTAAA